MEARIARRMRDHVLAVAEDHGVALRWVPTWRESEAYAGLNIAVIPEIRHPYDYLIALHEIGHCVSEEARDWNDEPGQYAVVLTEGAAWAWASAAAKRSLTKHLRAKDWDVVAYAFRTYIAGDWRTDPDYADSR